MKMKRNISICILVVLIVILVLIIAGRYRRSEDPIPDTEALPKAEAATEESVESSKTEENYQYIILEEDGRLTVYCSDNTTVYLETGIDAQTLPENLKSKLEQGIRMQTEEELFDFLESYSS